MNDWSIKSIQNIILEREEWEKKNLYATDSGKCPSGIYYQLIGAEATSPVDPKGLRRMEVGTMVEQNQVKKLRSLGLLIEAQRRIVDEEYNVSGRHDGIVISPTECTERAKDLIARKKEIFEELAFFDQCVHAMVGDYRAGLTKKEELIEFQTELVTKRQDLYDEEWIINQELLIPNPENSLIVMEIKSIVEFGFKMRESEGKPMDEHRNQLMFYMWKLREIYPWILGRIIYVDTSYQNLLEFNVDFDENVIEDMKRFWKYINECVETKTAPEPSPAVVRDVKTGKWKLNYQADWCRYHIHCTGDPNWKTKAWDQINASNPPSRARR